MPPNPMDPSSNRAPTEARPFGLRLRLLMIFTISLHAGKADLNPFLWRLQWAQTCLLS